MAASHLPAADRDRWDERRGAERGGRLQRSNDLLKGGEVETVRTASEANISNSHNTTIIRTGARRRKEAESHAEPR